jgi:3-oxoacyl-(acyl-carrier-protein) synthase
MSTVPTITGLNLRISRAVARAREEHHAPTQPRVAIAGCGLMTPLGTSSAQTWDAILAGRVIETHGQVPLTSRDGEPRVNTLAIHAAREAVAASSWTHGETGSDSTAILIGTSKGPIDAWLTAPPEHILNSAYAAAGGDDVFGLAGVCDAVAREVGAGAGPRLTLSAACASGLHALSRAWMMIRSRQVRRAIVVAAESSLKPPVFEQFQTPRRASQGWHRLPAFRPGP